MESHKAALAAAVQASGLGGVNVVPALSVEVEQKQSTGTSSHKAAYRRPTDDEIAAKLKNLQQPRVDLCKQITDQEIADRLLKKVKAPAQPEIVPQEVLAPADVGNGATNGSDSPAQLEAQRIRI
jgi:hypothetical protein